MLNKLHLNHHTPKAILYSLREQSGLNYPSFQIYQDQKGILTLCCIVCNPTCLRPMWAIDGRCFYKYLIYMTRLNPQFTRIDDGHGIKTKVLKCGSSEPNKGLGCLQAPNAQQSSEFTHHLMQCQAISSRASPAQISVKYAHSMLNAHIFPPR